MQTLSRKKQKGFTLIEVAIVLGVMGFLSLVIAALFLRTIDTYGKMTTETDTTKQARYCLQMVARDVRESVSVAGVSPGISDPNPVSLTGTARDALLLVSARSSNGDFVAPAPDYIEQPQSIVLFYRDTNAEGIDQLMRLQLYYDQDLAAYTRPFTLLAGDPYVGTDIVIVDDAGTQINVNRRTGAVAGLPPVSPPKILMNWTTSFDLINDGVNPIEMRLTCQFRDRNNRPVTCRLRTQVEPRNS